MNDIGNTILIIFGFTVIGFGLFIVIKLIIDNFDLQYANQVSDYIKYIDIFAKILYLF